MRSENRRGISGKIVVVLVLIVVLALVVTGIFLFISKSQGGESKVPDALSEQCAFACESGQKAAFCDVERTVSKDVAASCNDLSKDSKYSSYNVQACPAISCVAQVVDTTCSGVGGVWTTPEAGGNCPTQEGKFVRARSATDSAPVSGQVCCYYYA